MRKCDMRHWMILIVLAVPLVGLPVLGGCGRRSDPRDNPDFNEEAIDPSTVRMGEMGDGKDRGK